MWKLVQDNSTNEKKYKEKIVDKISKINSKVAILIHNRHFLIFSKYQLLSRECCCPEFKKKNIKPGENQKFERLLQKSNQFEELNILEL
jgi:hypothetical protein